MGRALFQLVKKNAKSPPNGVPNFRIVGRALFQLVKKNAKSPPNIVEDSGLRFAPSELDEKLEVLSFRPFYKPKLRGSKPNPEVLSFRPFADDRDFNIFRVRRMLDFISPSSLTYDEWLAVGMALKNIGFDCSDWENWSRDDERFKDGECESKWNGFNRDGYDIGTIFMFAQQGGYDAKETYREWKTLQRTFRSARISSVQGKRFVATEGSSRSIYSTPERSDFSMGNDNKSSNDFQAPNDHQISAK